MVTATIVYLSFLAYLFCFFNVTLEDIEGIYIVSIFSILFIFFYGIPFSILADKAYQRVSQFPLFYNLSIYILGGVLFPVVLSFVLNPDTLVERFDDFNYWYDVEDLWLGLTLSLLFWVVDFALKKTRMFNKG
ncbi:hypothetical protein ACFOUO_12155 [Salinithrix halophila]|uniref:ABC-2 type transport system permease protein n=1 Tax=Salinithrix halophila TaxID=1485204 RepID=A0ABV8JFM2_9BACL